MITTPATARLPEEEVIDFDRRLRCPVCRGTVQRQEIAAVNGWRRIEVFCTGLECPFRQIAGISVTGELRTFQGEEDVPPPAKRKLKRGERRPGAMSCAAARCDKPIIAKRLCQTHYYRWGELGKPGGDDRLAWLEAGGPPVRDWKPPEAPEPPEASESPEGPEPPEPAERAESPKPPAAAPKSPAKASRRPESPHGPPAEGSTEPPAKPRRPPEAATTAATAAPAPSEPPAPPEPGAPRPPQRPHGPPAEGSTEPPGEPRRPPQAPTTPATAAPVAPPSTASRLTSGGGLRGKFIAFREATELLRLELPRGTNEIVLVRTGQFLTIGRLDGLVLGQIPIAEMH